MTISKKLLLIGTFLATGMTQAVSMKDFDITLVNPYIRKAQTWFASIEYKYGHSWEPSWKDHATIVKDEKFYKNLRKQKKAALKAIVKELKDTANSLKDADKALWLPARQLYKAFKHGVYKTWKKTNFLLEEQVNGTIVLE